VGFFKRVAKIAASFNKFAKSAPEKPIVRCAIWAIETEGSNFLPRA